MTTPPKPNQRLEKELDYHDSDHSHAHGMNLKYFNQSTGLRRRMLSINPLSSDSIQAHNPQNPLSGYPSSLGPRRRRASHDAMYATAPRLFIVNVEVTKKLLLDQEDTDRDGQITVEDTGPKVFVIPTANSGGFNKVEIRGTYAISNLLQELELATDHGRKFIILSEDRLFENPVQRMERLIKFHFWDGLTRRIDADGLEAICADPKNRQEDHQNRIYVPYYDQIGLAYYNKVAQTRRHLRLDVVHLPEYVTSNYVNSINSKPGVLALGLRKIDPEKGWDDISNVCGTPFVVPGGRFNEQYGWDSYFEALGLIVDGRIGLAQGMIENFVYEIEHYGKILNANRSYYLTRSQPPFLTDMVRQVYAAFGRTSDLPPVSTTATLKKIWKDAELKEWLACATRASIKELFSIWLSHPRLDSVVGLSKYYTEGEGIPPETEPDHFHAILKPYADKEGLSEQEFERLYTKGEIRVAELDEYFIHDRAVRESGHDTTYRFDGKCANVATIDLNCLVYKFEEDLEQIIEQEFGGSFTFKVRRGQNDENLIGYTLWKETLDSDGVDKMIGGGSIWNSSWAKGIKIYHNSTTDGNHNDPTPLVDDDHHHSFTVTLPSSLFRKLSTRTHCLINQYLWSEKDSLYFDYDCKQMKRSKYESATALWALWAKIASKEQAEKLVPRCLELFEVEGGIVATTEASRGEITEERPERQWDYPYGWAPHQMLAWKGLTNYSHIHDSQRLTYRWLYTCIKAFVDFNGVVPEKFDVVGMTHKVNVEYGNVGSDFQYVVREGFGWMNASVQVGLKDLPRGLRRSLGALVHPDIVFKKA
ncbi:UNVERIFIED_CONTAM: alpha,alpha-trehalase nth1 [Siphonaria sp. JEL0065]|nr:alpha,alpha-trehalase nth1 [Siphonaria sp. JEL0065]